MSAQLRQVAAENQAIVDAGRYKTADGEEIETVRVHGIAGVSAR